MKFNTRYILIALGLLLVGFLIYTFREIFSYVIVAWVISMIGAPLVKVLRKYIGKTLAAGVTLAVICLGMVFVLYLVVPPIVNQARNISKIDIESVAASLEEPISDWENWLAEKGLITNAEELYTDSTRFKSKKELDKFLFEEKIQVDSVFNPLDSTYISTVNVNVKIDASDFLEKKILEEEEDLHKELDFFDRLRLKLTHFLNPQLIQGIFTSTIGTFGDIVIGLMSVLFIAFFFLKEQGLFYDMIKAAVPNQYEPKVQVAIDGTTNLLIRYFDGILLQMTIITIFVSASLSLLGIKNSLLIGALAALMNVIPYIGPILGAGFAVLITVSSNIEVPFYDELLPQIIKVCITFVVMQLLDNFVIQPNIFSKSVKAHPLEIFLVVLIGAQLGGVLGMVLAIPVYTIFRVVGKVFLSEFKVIQSLTKNI